MSTYDHFAYSMFTVMWKTKKETNNNIESTVQYKTREHVGELSPRDYVYIQLICNSKLVLNEM